MLFRSVPVEEHWPESWKLSHHYDELELHGAAPKSGYAYTYDYADDVRDTDQVFEAFDTKVVIDKESLAFMDGSKLDFVKEGLKQIFKFENPNVDATCGCGESFSVKEKTQ